MRLLNPHSPLHSPNRSELAPKRQGAGGVAWQVSGAGEDAMRALAAALPGHASTPVRAATAAATQSFAGLRDDEYEEERRRLERKEAGLERRLEELRKHESEVAQRAQAVARQRETLAREAKASVAQARERSREEEGGAGWDSKGRGRIADAGEGAEGEEDKENVSSPEGMANEAPDVRNPPAAVPPPSPLLLTLPLSHRPMRSHRATQGPALPRRGVPPLSPFAPWSWRSTAPCQRHRKRSESCWTRVLPSYRVRVYPHIPFSP